MPLSCLLRQALLSNLHFPLHDFLQSCNLLFLPLWLVIIHSITFLGHLALFFSLLLVLLMRICNDAHEHLLFAEIKISSNYCFHNPEDALVFALQTE